MSQRIQYLTHQQIDKQQWDACMDRASNSLLYGYSMYLDAMTQQWDALVLNDYEAVMPLPWKSKWGIRYLYEPFLCAMLGVFAKSCTPALVNSFLSTIPTQFRYWDISFNPYNQVAAAPWKTYQRQNFVLPLQAEYHALHAAFSDNIKRNIKKASKTGLVMGRPQLQEVLTLAQQQMKLRNDFQPQYFEHFTQAYQLMVQHNAAINYGVYDASGTLLAAAIFFIWRNRAYYILPGNHPAGRQSGASHAVVNAFIQEHAASQLVLDFEGSDVDSVALFYKGFGASAEQYQAIRYNRLPDIIKWMKQ